MGERIGGRLGIAGCVEQLGLRAIRSESALDRTKPTALGFLRGFGMWACFNDDMFEARGDALC